LSPSKGGCFSDVPDISKRLQEFNEVVAEFNEVVAEALVCVLLAECVTIGDFTFL
jgi:hypothetical protein